MALKTTGKRIEAPAITPRRKASFRRTLLRQKIARCAC